MAGFILSVIPKLIMGVAGVLGTTNAIKELSGGGLKRKRKRKHPKRKRKAKPKPRKKVKPRGRRKRR